MAIFVLVPGAWLGGWCWQRVTPLLRAAGHVVYTPTLTGLGERVHLGTPETDLATHIRDVVNVLEYEDLREVVLVGHSYGGVVVGGVADRVPDRVAQLIYVTANLPHDGRAIFDDWSAAGRAVVEEEARLAGEGRRWSLGPALGKAGTGLSESDARWLHAKATDHPLGTFAQPLSLTNPRVAIPRAYIWCSEDGSRLPEEVVTAANDGRWERRELATGHWSMLSMPRELADLFLDLRRT